MAWDGPAHLALLLLTLAGGSGCWRAPAVPGGRADAGAPAPVAIRVETVDRYLVYGRLLQPQLERLAQEGQPPDGGEATVARWEAVEAEARRRAGLSAAQVEALRDLTVQVVLARRARAQAERGTLARLRAQLQQAPPEQRPALERELAQGEARARQVESAREARARYGDAAVEAVLAREEALAALLLEEDDGGTPQGP